MTAHGVERDAGQAHVLADCQIRNQRWILVDGDDARSTRFCGRAEGLHCAAKRQGPAIGRKYAGQNFDQRAFASAVRAHERVDLATGNCQRRRFEGDNRAKSLGEIANFKQRRRIVHFERARICPRNDEHAQRIAE